jgi:hypothetical protein
VQRELARQLPIEKLQELCEGTSSGGLVTDLATREVCRERESDIQRFFADRYGRELNACVPILGRDRCEEILAADECVRDLALCAADADVCTLVDD